MDTDFDEALAAMTRNSDDDSATEEGSQASEAQVSHKRKSLGSAKSAGKPKKQKQNKSKDDREGLCFIATCPNKKLAKSKFCKVDKAAVDAIICREEGSIHQGSGRGRAERSCSVLQSSG